MQTNVERKIKGIACSYPRAVRASVGVSRGRRGLGLRSLTQFPATAGPGRTGQQSRAAGPFTRGMGRESRLSCDPTRGGLDTAL